MASDPRLRQLSRIYNRILETPEDARTAITAEPGVLASALFHEAAASDDVTSVETGMAYLEGRLAELSVFASESAPEIRRQFAAKIAAWDESP
jgi:hypothetical protein